MLQGTRNEHISRNNQGGIAHNFPYLHNFAQTGYQRDSGIDPANIATRKIDQTVNGAVHSFPWPNKLPPLNLTHNANKRNNYWIYINMYIA